MIGKSKKATEEKRLKSGILVVRGLPFLSGMILAVPEEWNDGQPRKNTHPDLQQIGAKYVRIATP